MIFRCKKRRETGDRGQEMGKKYFSLSLVFLLIFFSSDSFAQKKYKDFWQWNTFSLEKKINVRWSINFEEELRFFDNATRINLFYTNLGFTYKINRLFKAAVVYRHIQKSTNTKGYSSRHRIYADLIFKYKINKITLGYRSRLQTQVRDVRSSEDGTTPESYWRNKFDFKYTAKEKFTPYIAAEFRYQFPNPRLQEANNKFNRGRFYFGCDYEVNKKNTVGLYYMIQDEFNVNEAEIDYVLGVQYAISL